MSKELELEVWWSAFQRIKQIPNECRSQNCSAFMAEVRMRIADLVRELSLDPKEWDTENISSGLDLARSAYVPIEDTAAQDAEQAIQSTTNRIPFNGEAITYVDAEGNHHQGELYNMHGGSRADILIRTTSGNRIESLIPDESRAGENGYWTV